MNSPLYLTRISVTCNTYIPSVTGQGLQEAVSEMETGVQKVYWGVLSGSKPVGEERGGKEAHGRSWAVMQSLERLQLIARVSWS